MEHIRLQPRQAAAPQGSSNSVAWRIIADSRKVSSAISALCRRRAPSCTGGWLTWVVAQKRFSVPFRLQQQYILEKDPGNLRPGTDLVIPRIVLGPWIWGLNALSGCAARRVSHFWMRDVPCLRCAGIRSGTSHC